MKIYLLQPRKHFYIVHYNQSTIKCIYHCYACLICLALYNLNNMHQKQIGIFVWIQLSAYGYCTENVWLLTSLNSSRFKDCKNTYYNDSLDIKPLVVTRVIEIVKIGYNRQSWNGSKSKTQATISMKVTLMSLLILTS